MKPVSVKTQEKLMFVPCVNCFMLFILFYNHYAAPLSPKVTHKAFFSGICCAVPTFFLLNILADVFPVMETTLGYLEGYLMALTSGFGFVRQQKPYVIGSNIFPAICHGLPEFESYLNSLSLYLVPMAMGYGFIRYQQKLGG